MKLNRYYDNKDIRFNLAARVDKYSRHLNTSNKRFLLIQRGKKTVKDDQPTYGWGRTESNFVHPLLKEKKIKTIPQKKKPKPIQPAKPIPYQSPFSTWHSFYDYDQVTAIEKLRREMQIDF